MNYLKNGFVIISSLLILIVVGSGCKEFPEPLPTQEAVISAQENLYYPIYFTYPQCPYLSDKKGLAYAYAYNVLARVSEDLCVNPSAIVRTWSAIAKPGWSLNMHFIPTIWSDKQLNDFINRIPADYSDWVLVGNECDQTDQCNITPEELAAVYIEAHAHCQSCKFISPGLASDETNGEWLRQWRNDFIEQGGSLDWIYAVDSHHYISTSDAHNAYLVYGSGQCQSADRLCQVEFELNRRLDILKTVIPNKPLVVSEIGSCPSSYANEWIARQLNVLEQRTDVIWYAVFVDSQYWPFQPCGFQVYELSNPSVLNWYGIGIKTIGTTTRAYP